MTKVMYRKYDHGEVVALFPNVAGDPAGDYCAAFALTGGFYFADPAVVVKLTKPAERKEYARVEKALKSKHEMSLTLVSKVPAGAQKMRAADPDAHSRFPRLSRMHINR